MTKREKSMLIVILLLLTILICKSLFFDEAQVTGDALLFKEFVEKTIDTDEKHTNFLEKIGIANKRVVAIKKTHMEGTSSISIYDEQKRKISGAYQAKVRGYILYIIPYKEFRINSEWSEEKVKK
ncbi:hypothetical protein [Crassaminicella profunda]|uniref:hypothetical protein n=1 Tax=Crassaminicella profunda TaxID=1286698 RepID=UPI001CA79D5A|nr:hypothetical protein [Crassaminicella profunda]QZY54648.1 hypothetical protein K7H06_16640 [Crassaminicella profunda]